MSKMVPGEVMREHYLSQMNWRYAVKKFDSVRKISDQDWDFLKESLRLSPSSYGLQPWKFLVVQNPDLRAQLKSVSWNQSQVTDCSHFVVLTTLKSIDAQYIDKYVRTVAGLRAVPVESLAGYRKSMEGDLLTGPRSADILNWSRRQVYIAMGNLMAAAALVSIDACPMEGLDPAKYDQILGLEGSTYGTVAAVAVGYRHSEDGFAKAKKVRYSGEEVFEVR